MQSKRWTITLPISQLPQPVGIDFQVLTEQLTQLIGSKPGVTYLVLGYEVGQGGLQHLQGYIEFSSKRRMLGVKEVLGWPAAHLEAAKGSPGQASEYCKKDGVFSECGAISVNAQGKRTDLDLVVEAIKDGRSMQQLWMDFPKTMIRNHQGIAKCFAKYNRKEFEVKYQLGDFRWELELDLTRTTIFTGVAGCGKTSYAKALLPRALLVSHMDRLGDYDADVYDGIIFDDMSFSHLPRESQIHLVDIDEARDIHIRYQIAHIPANTKKIFTTNLIAGTIFDISDAAIARRIHIIKLV